MAEDYVGWGIGIAAIVATTGVAIWAGLRQTPKHNVRVDGIALKYMSIGESNLFICTITNHGTAVGEIARAEVDATVDGSFVAANIGAINVRGSIGAGESKQLWLDVVLPEPIWTDVHDGRRRLRVVVALHMAKSKTIRSGFAFSRDPGYRFVPSTAT